MKKRYIIALILILTVFTLLRLNILTQDTYCFGWDCPFYLNQLKLGNVYIDNVSPVFMIVADGMNQIVGNEVVTIKLLQLLMPIILSIGVFIFCNKFLRINQTLLAVIMINLMTGMSRIWFDLYRNYMLICILPYFLYFLISEKRYSTICATILLYLMSTIHITFAFLIPVLLLYALISKNKDIWKKILTIIIISMMAYFLTMYLSPNEFGLFMFLDHMQAERMPEYLQQDMIQTTFYNLHYMNFFTSNFVMIGLISILFFKKRDDIENLMMSMFVVLFLLTIIPLSIISTRTMVMIVIPTIIMILLFFERYVINIPTTMVFPKFEIKYDSKYLFLSILLLGACMTGLTYMQGSRDSISDGEEFAFEYLRDKQDFLLITTNRQLYWAEYLLGEGYRYESAVWRQLNGVIEPDQYAMIFVGNYTESYKILESYNESRVYLLFDYWRDPVNVSFIEGKDYLKEVYRNKNTTLMIFEEIE